MNWKYFKLLLLTITGVIMVSLVFSMLLLMILFTSVFAKYSHDLNGIYFASFKSTIIKMDIGLNESHEVLNHEYGHHIWYYKLNLRQKNYYEDISLKTKEYCWLGYNNNVREDFADSYAAYVENTFLCEEKLKFFEVIENGN